MMGPRSFIAAAAGVLLSASPAAAVTITVTSAQAEASIPICLNAAYQDCVSSAYVTTTSLTGDNSKFKDGFDAWNAQQAADSKWSLVNGGSVPGGAFEIFDFGATAENFTGGMYIDFDWTYEGADKHDYIWVQGAYANYVVDDTATGTLVPPYPLLDVYTPKPGGPPCTNTDSTDTVENLYCGPIYPIQYADRSFFDNPHGPWDDAFFDAFAFVSKVDQVNRTVTIYEGINYGFKLSADSYVPEPATWALMIAGFFGLGANLRRRRFSATNLARAPI